MFAWLFKLIPHKHRWKYRGNADGGLAETVYLWRCSLCHKKDVRY